MNVFELEDYRDFLIQRIKLEKSTYTLFSKKYSKHISIDALKRLLSRGRNKTRFLGNYKMSNDRFIDLLFDLRPKLTENEILHLFFLKLIQDSEKTASGLSSKLSRLIQKNLVLAQSVEKGSKNKPNQSATAGDIISEGLLTLPSSMRKKAEIKLLNILLIHLMRVEDHPDSSRIIKKIKDFN